MVITDQQLELIRYFVAPFFGSIFDNQIKIDIESKIDFVLAMDRTNYDFYIEYNVMDHHIYMTYMDTSSSPKLITVKII